MSSTPVYTPHKIPVYTGVLPVCLHTTPPLSIEWCGVQVVYTWCETVYEWCEEWCEIW